MKLDTLTALMSGAALAALLAGTAIAQDATPEGELTTEEPAVDTMADAAPEDMDAGFASLEEMTVGDVLGMVVFDPEDDRIAEIDYVVQESDGAKAILGIGGFLGIGEYTVAVPLEELELREEGVDFWYQTDRETLRELPEYDESQAENLPDDTPIASLLQTSQDGPASGAPDAAEGMADDAQSDGEAAIDDSSAGDAMSGGDAEEAEDMSAEEGASETEETEEANQ